MGLGGMRIEPKLIADDGRPGICYIDSGQGLSRRLIVMTKVKFFENESNL
jgi:hypothetical protein